VPKQLLSIVLPCYNEEQNVGIVYKELKKQINEKKYSYEFVFVNDGSKDKSWQKISELVAKDAHVRGLNFSRNFGHHAALEAGLKAARGDVIVMMDTDLQHPPELVPKLITLYEQGNDIVNTVRRSNEKTGPLKKLTGKLFYRTLNSISDLQLNDGEADFRLVSRKVADTLNGLPESPKFYRGLVNWIGYKVAHVSYDAAPRLYGHSSYTFKKMIELARLGLTSFSMKPLKFIITFGVALASLSFVGLITMMVIKWGFGSHYFSNNAILVVFLIFVTGILSTFQGIVAIYLVDIFNASKNRPSYIIEDEAGKDK
jgi:glycosyltransferase involved in cell wall biosynthesis